MVEHRLLAGHDELLEVSRTEAHMLADPRTADSSRADRVCDPALRNVQVRRSLGDGQEMDVSTVFNGLGGHEQAPSKEVGP